MEKMQRDVTEMNRSVIIAGGDYLYIITFLLFLTVHILLLMVGLSSSSGQKITILEYKSTRSCQSVFPNKLWNSIKLKRDESKDGCNLKDAYQLAVKSTTTSFCPALANSPWK